MSNEANIREFAINTSVESDLYGLHSMVWSCFDPDEKERPFLFRFEKIGDMGFVHVRSTVKPARVPETMLAEPSFSLREGQRLRFDIRAVPVKRTTDDKRRETPLRGKAILDWFMEKAKTRGFDPIYETLRFQNRPTRFQKGESMLTVNDTVISGQLIVTDPQTFCREALAKGIGRYKAFGFGMLRCWE